MNELKPEDVMRALERCKGGGNACLDCFYFYRAVDTSCAPFLIKDALALLREKDALIAKHEAYIDNLNDDKSCLVEQIEKKDAEIERLRDLLKETAEYNEAWVKDNGDLRKALKTARAEAITEFEEKVVGRFNTCDKAMYSQTTVHDVVARVAKEMREENES